MNTELRSIKKIFSRVKEGRITKLDTELCYVRRGKDNVYANKCLTESALMNLFVS